MGQTGCNLEVRGLISHHRHFFIILIEIHIISKNLRYFFNLYPLILMTVLKEVKRFQEFLMNAWPAEQYYFLNGWILRFTKGVTYRANSVMPINYTGNSTSIENDIEMVENAYKSFFYLKQNLKCFLSQYLKFNCYGKIYIKKNFFR